MKLGRGVRQGGPISRKLFTCILEDVFRKLDWEDKYGITLNGKKLTNLRFADDIVLFSPDPKNLQAMLLELDNHSRLS